MENEAPVLVVNPATDNDFWGAAERALAGGPSIESFTARLRESYPQASVHLREIVGERVIVWYVYREGHWTSAD